MKPRLLVLSRYSRLGASSRLRTLQYKPWLEKAGFKVEYATFFDDDYLKHLYTKKKSNVYSLKYYLKRLILLKQRFQFDIIWIEYEALPWVPWFIERALLPKSVPIVCDYDDAIFHRYDQHRFLLVQKLLGTKIDNIMKSSNLVTAGNEYLANRARCADTKNIKIIPTVVDLLQYSVKSKSSQRNLVKVGWIGTPNTWVSFGKEKYLLIEHILKNHNALFMAVGAQLDTELLGTLEMQKWDENTEVNFVQDMDIGIMPLTDTPWANGKCGYKLLQYMACGLPVIASPVGVNEKIVEHGVNGFLAQTDEDWKFYIKKLLSDSDLRCRMGAAGRKKVEKEFSLQVWGPHVAKTMQELLSGVSKT